MLQPVLFDARSPVQGPLMAVALAIVAVAATAVGLHQVERICLFDRAARERRY